MCFLVRQLMEARGGLEGLSSLCILIEEGFHMPATPVILWFLKSFVCGSTVHYGRYCWHNFPLLVLLPSLVWFPSCHKFKPLKGRIPSVCGQIVLTKRFQYHPFLIKHIWGSLEHMAITYLLWIFRKYCVFMRETCPSAAVAVGSELSGGSEVIKGLFWLQWHSMPERLRLTFCPSLSVKMAPFPLTHQNLSLTKLRLNSWWIGHQAYFNLFAK